MGTSLLARPLEYLPFLLGGGKILVMFSTLLSLILWDVSGLFMEPTTLFSYGGSVAH